MTDASTTKREPSDLELAFAKLDQDANEVSTADVPLERIVELIRADREANH